MNHYIFTFLSMGLSVGTGWLVYTLTGSLYYALLSCWFVASISGCAEGVAE